MDRRFPPRFASRSLPSVVAALIVAIVLVTSSCDTNDAPVQATEMREARATLPDLASVGGVQDVWAFDFSMTSDRSQVRAELGEPTTVVESQAAETGSGPQIVRWLYNGLEITFLIDALGEHEYLLSVRIDDADVPLRGGLSIGMPAEEAMALLGEAEVNSDQVRVFFYRSTTIEIVVDDGAVTEVHLARALP